MSYNASMDCAADPTGETPIARAPRAPRKVLRALALTGLGLLWMACLAAAAGWLTWDGVRWPAGASDREVIITVEDLAPRLGMPPDGKASLKKRLCFDGGTDLEYSFESEDRSVSIDFRVSICPTEGSARSGYSGVSAAAKFMKTLQPLMSPAVIRESAGRVAWGDESLHMQMERDGQPAGSFLVARKGKRFVLLVIGGVSLDDGALREAILPRLEKLEAYGG